MFIRILAPESWVSRQVVFEFTYVVSLIIGRTLRKVRGDIYMRGNERVKARSINLAYNLETKTVISDMPQANLMLNHLLQSLQSSAMSRATILRTLEAQGTRA